MTRVDCECGAFFEVSDELVGGYANCPRCRKAAAVPGLHDPAWTWLQAAALVAVVAASVVAWRAGGPALGVAVGLGLAGLLWAVSRAL